ncbi:MAG: 50S ribosomal protein L7/L12 [Bacilli bacterium]|jgi:large subunit ribosomal protein L7/L12|nr:50S ribosomal protein L7/L12 [Bacilli bacterium]MEE3464788.1 50S ribosomal protein L7/L12 [Candidatus Enteromonas sp.]MBO7121338.1 50S ribosomal protein L7/L12 [Bacilli bacterium]MBR5750677.1 50S ribosomal protein L7/L12 [Bacilli bacterium]MBR5990402.1 50S ribosomal protein L7/L12 [Bacilli bacterium]
MAEKLTNEQIIDTLKQMSALELSNLVKAVEEEFGVTAAAPVAAAAPAEEEESAKKGPSEVSLFLKGLGTAGKVAVIKAVQTITGLGLMDAKKLVDACPCAIKEKISPVEAEAHGKVLKDAGAEIEIK